MDTDTKTIIIVSFAIFSGCFFSAFIGHSNGVKSVKIEAVKAGVAEWPVDSEGHKYFTWNQPEPRKGE